MKLYSALDSTIQQTNGNNENINKTKCVQK